MNNFPSKWLDFTTSKEIKRMHKDISSTLSLKIEIATSILLVIISLFFSKHIEKWDIQCQVIVCGIVCLIVLGVFFASNICKWISIRRNCNVIIKGKDAASIFDEEVVYDVLVAAEYYNMIQSINNSNISKELKAFYLIEIEYYLDKSVEQLLVFNTNYTNIFGDGKNRISVERIKNILELIKSIKDNSNIKLDDEKNKLFESFCETIDGI